MLDYQQIKSRCSGHWPEIIGAIVPSMQEGLSKAPRKQADDPVSGKKKCIRFFPDFATTGGLVINVNGGIICSEGFIALKYLLQSDFTTVYNRVRAYFGEPPVGEEPGTAGYIRQFTPPSKEGPPPTAPPDNYRDAPYHVDPKTPLGKDHSVRKGPDPQWVHDLLTRLWKESIPQQHPKSELLHYYMASRDLKLPKDCKDIRFHPNLPYMETDDKTGKPVEIFRFPAMLALARSREGKPVTLHRTWLAPDGSGKAVVPEDYSAKMTLPCLEGQTLAGASVRLYQPDNTLGIAEGIETAIAAHMMDPGLAVWPTLSAYFVRSFLPPDGVKNIIFFADSDVPPENEDLGVGLKSMAIAAQAAAQRGLNVSIQPAPVRNARRKSDYADVWTDLITGNPERKSA